MHHKLLKRTSRAGHVCIGAMFSAHALFGGGGGAGSRAHINVTTLVKIELACSTTHPAQLCRSKFVEVYIHFLRCLQIY